MQSSEHDVAQILIPGGYTGEPSNFPGLELVFVPEIESYAIVRFFTDVSGMTAMRPIYYEPTRPLARQRLAVCRRALATALTERH